MIGAPLLVSNMSSYKTEMILILSSVLTSQTQNIHPLLVLIQQKREYFVVTKYYDLNH
jgi:hypothetical protein